MWMLQLSFWLEFALEATDLEVGHKETEVLERDSGSRAREGEGRVRKCELAAVPGKQLREQVREREGAPLLSSAASEDSHIALNVSELVLFWRDVWLSRHLSRRTQFLSHACSHIWVP